MADPKVLFEAKEPTTCKHGWATNCNECPRGSKFGRPFPTIDDVAENIREDIGWDLQLKKIMLGGGISRVMLFHSEEKGGPDFYITIEQCQYKNGKD